MTTGLNYDETTSSPIVPRNYSGPYLNTELKDVNMTVTAHPPSPTATIIPPTLPALNRLEPSESGLLMDGIPCPSVLSREEPAIRHVQAPTRAVRPPGGVPIEEDNASRRARPAY